MADFDAEVKIGGLAILLTVAVIDNLNFELTLGMDFVQEARAIINERTNTLSLFDGLTGILMTATGKHLVSWTDRLVGIPPLSEAVFPVVTLVKLAERDYVIEGDLPLPCRTLLVAWTLLNGAGGKLTCRLLNPTADPVKLKLSTPVGTIAAVHAEPMTKTRHAAPDALPPIADMRCEQLSKGGAYRSRIRRTRALTYMA